MPSILEKELEKTARNLQGKDRSGVRCLFIPKFRCI